MKKRYIVMMLAAGLTILLLSACGDSSSASDQTEDATGDNATENNSHEDSEKENENDQDTKANHENDDSQNAQETTDRDSTQNNDAARTEEDTSRDKQDGTNTSSNANADEDKKNAGDAKQINSMDEALEHLKTKLDENDEINLDDTEFIPDDRSPMTDDKGTYYIVSLKSKSMKEEGGSGTVGKYQVYQNGDFELAY